MHSNLLCCSFWNNMKADLSNENGNHTLSSYVNNTM